MVMTETIACNLCGSHNVRSFCDGIDRLHGFEGTFQYVRCQRCGMIFMNPQILFEELAHYYPQDYAPHKAAEKSKEPKAITLPIRKKYLNTISAQSRILDVGCGNGAFLARVRALTGCEAFGLDISPNAVNTAGEQYDVQVFQGTVFDAPYPLSSFDVITAWSYIEHVNDPFGAIEKMFTLLKPGGCLILKTPNAASFNARLFKEKWYHLDCPRHLFLFSPHTLAAMLEKAGFHLDGFDYEKGSKGMIASLQYYFYGNNYTAPTRNRLRQSKWVKAGVSPLSKFLWLIKQSDTLVVYAKKPAEPI